MGITGWFDGHPRGRGTRAVPAFPKAGLCYSPGKPLPPLRWPFMEGASQIRIGTAGWSYKDWEGVFYPPEVQRRKLHPLEYLAHFFDVVEINTSFYGHIKPELAKLWVRKVAPVNPNFVFTAKLHRSFTHSPLAVMEPTSAASIKPTDEDEAKAREGLDALASEGKLGALLIQFPVSFKNTSLNREYLEKLLRQFIGTPARWMCVTTVGTILRRWPRWREATLRSATSISR